jgi:hypothetical protein
MVVGRKDLGQLTGEVVQRKIGSRMLFANHEEDLSGALEAVPAFADELLREWLIGPLPILISTVAKRLPRPKASRDAVTVLLHEAIRNSRFLVLGMLTRDGFEPYLSLARIKDIDEIERQLTAIESVLALRGRVMKRDLPEPLRSRSLQAWRDSILRHTEFLGLGSYSDGSLAGWSQ